MLPVIPKPTILAIVFHTDNGPLFISEDDTMTSRFANAGFRRISSWITLCTLPQQRGPQRQVSSILDPMRPRAGGVVPNDVEVLSSGEPGEREEKEREYRCAGRQRTPDDHEHDDLAKQSEAQSVEKHDQEDSDRRQEEYRYDKCES
jgi:hypothetical protein